MVRKTGGKDVATKDQFTKPNAAFALASGAAFAFLPYLGAPGWLIGFVCLWLVFWLTALIDETVTYSKLPSWLEDQDFKQVYRWVVLRRFAWLWKRAAYPVPKRAGLFRTLNGAFSYRVWDFSLRVAVVYPIMLCMLPWLIWGADGYLGDVWIFTGTAHWWDFWPHRAINIVIFAILIAGLIGRKLASTSPYAFAKSHADWLLLIASAVASSREFGFTYVFVFEFALVVALAFAYGFPHAFAFAVAVTFIFSYVGGPELAEVVTLAVAVAGAGAGELLEDKRKFTLASFVLIFAVGLVLIEAATTINWTERQWARNAQFIFLCVFPIINALFDTLSYALTLTLMRLGLRHWSPVICAVVDFLCACVIFIALGATLTTVIAGLNAVAGVTILDIGATFDAIEAAPQDHLWVFAMLFSTLLPTAIHFALSLFGTQVFVPAVIRHAVAGQLRAARTNEFAAVTGPMLAGLIGTAPFAIVAGLGALIWHFGQDAALWLIAGYGDVLRGIASSIAAL